MIIKNKLGKVRNMQVLLEIKENSNKYIIYKDINTLNIYGGRIDNNILKSLNEEEYNKLNKVLEKVLGSEV